MSKDPTIDPSTRRILNSNRGMNNIVRMVQERGNTVSLLNSFIELLFRHCGPLSKYAMTVNGDSAGITFEPNVFTRDGIDILSAVECMSPIENYIKELLCYLGSRVDNVAKDGTTTSMLFGALFLKYLLQPYDVKPTTSYQEKQQVKQVFDDLRNALNLTDAVWTIDRLCSADQSEKNIMHYAGKVAFIQAMSSSGGDVELALAMKKIYERSPRITWDFIEHYQSISETGERFNVEIDDFDSKIRCTSTQEGALNTALGTEYYAENVRCIIYPDSFSTYDTKLDQMIYYLKEVDDEHPVVLVMTHVPAQLLSALMQINETRTNKISVWQFSASEKLAGQALNWELMIVNAVAGVMPFNHPSVTSDKAMSDEYTFIAKEVRWRNTYMEFYGTVESSEDDCLHPYYADPSKATPYYKEVMDELLAKREMYSDNRIQNDKLVGIFTEMLNKIACLHRPRLRLGGPAHEQVANIPVVKDVQGAIMSSLRHGFLLSGVLDIYKAIWYFLQDRNLVDIYPSMRQVEILRDAISAFDCIAEYIYDHNPTSMVGSLDNIPGDMKKFLDRLNFASAPPAAYRNSLCRGTEYECKGFLTIYFALIDKYIEQLATGEVDDEVSHQILNNYPVMQPVKITEELFKRVQELLMKFSRVSEIIVYGGVMMKESKKKGS